MALIQAAVPRVTFTTPGSLVTLKIDRTCILRRKSEEMEIALELFTTTFSYLFVFQSHQLPKAIGMLS